MRPRHFADNALRAEWNQRQKEQQQEQTTGTIPDDYNHYTSVPYTEAEMSAWNALPDYLNTLFNCC